MFVRKNKNRSGSISVQIISKNFGKYKVVKTLGSSFDPDEVNRLALEAKQAIFQSKGQLKLLSCKSKSDLMIESFVSKLKNSQIHTVGPELIFGALFDRIGFNTIPEEYPPNTSSEALQSGSSFNSKNRRINLIG